MKATLLLVAGLLACAPAAVPPPAPPAPRIEPSAPRGSHSALDAALVEDMAAERAIPWSAARRLAWSNFQGRPPQSGDEGARTAYGLYYAWSCRGTTFGFHVIAAFHPLRSWVKPAVVRHASENPRVLRHEQTHFDITEVFARRMRQQMGALTKPCARGDVEVRSITRQLVDDEKQTQQRYDRETNHGLVSARQAEWNAEVAKMLRAVERYAL